MNRTLWTVSLMLVLLVGCGDRSVFGFPDAAVDASMDSGPNDLGPVDMGPRDLGFDLGPIDMGPDDMGPDDLGPGDGGPPDMGPPDGGPTDMGPRDMGPPDMGPPDMGPRDMGPPDMGPRDMGPPDMGPPDMGMSDAGRLGPAPVELGPITDLAQAGAYVLIGKSGITNVTGSLISGGHLGVSPVAASTITGFGLILDASGQFSTSSSVVPPAKVYAADYAVPTPSNLTSAILSMEGGYTDAAGRPTPDFLNLLGGNIAGRTLTPGLYTWGTSVNIASAITISGGANDTWIFQVTGDLDLSAAVRVILAGGARADHIWWQVAGQTTLHSTSHFEGIILCQTGITMQTGASLHGRALAQSLIALDNNAITAP